MKNRFCTIPLSQSLRWHVIEPKKREGGEERYLFWWNLSECCADVDSLRLSVGLGDVVENDP